MEYACWVGQMFEGKKLRKLLNGVFCWLDPGCWVLSDPNSTSYFLLWLASHSMLIWWVRQKRLGFSGEKVPFPSALLQVTVLD